MTSTVSVSELRKNLADYLDMLKNPANAIVVKDSRKDEPVVKLTGSKVGEFDWQVQIKAARAMSPFLSGQEVEKMKKARQSISARLNRAKSL